MKLFSPARMLKAHRDNWEREQAANNTEAIDLATRKMNFIIEHGTKEHVIAFQNMMAKANEIANLIYMMPLGADTSEFTPHQNTIIAALDALIEMVEEHSGEKFS